MALQLEQVEARMVACLAEQLGVTDVTVEGLAVPTGGYSSDMVSFTARWRTPEGLTEHRLIARVEPAESALFMDADLMLEWNLLTALADRPGVPVPPLVLREVEGAVFGRRFFVMEFVEGRVPTNTPPYHVAGWVPELSVPERAAMWFNGIDALARLHQLDWHDGFEFLSRPEHGADGLAQHLDWNRRYHEWVMRGRTHPVLDAGLAYLLGEHPVAADESVLWGDSRPGNLIVADDNTVAAVIDWEMAALGPGEVDLAWWLVMDHLHADGLRAPRLPGLPDKAATIARYEQVRGRPVRDFHYYEVLAAYRYATILVRFADVYRGSLLSADTSFGTNSHAMRYLAELLGLPVPELSPEVLSLLQPLSL